MKRLLKYALLSACLTLFVGNVLCLAQTDGQATNPPAPPTTGLVGPMSDFDKIEPNPGSLGTRAEHWRERSSGTYLEFFDINSGYVLGWTLLPGSDRGYDKYGKVASNYTAHWSTQGSSRFSGSAEIGYMSPYPYSNYDYYNGWGIGGSGTMTTVAGYYQGSYYESFFDGVMEAPNAVGWTDDGYATWDMVYVSDPGNYIDNRVYSYAGNGVGTGWKGTTHDYGYSSTYGFSFNADVCRTDDEGTWAYGMFFYADNPGGPVSNCYAIKIADSTSGYHYFSVWKYTAGSPSSLIAWFQDPAVNPSGEWNNLKVETLGGNMEFWCNGYSMGTVYDTSFTYGNIGVGVYDPDGYATCLWDNITVHRQPSVKIGKGGDKPEPETDYLKAVHPGP